MKGPHCSNGLSTLWHRVPVAFNMVMSVRDWPSQPSCWLMLRNVVWMCLWMHNKRVVHWFKVRVRSFVWSSASYPQQNIEFNFVLSLFLLLWRLSCVHFFGWVWFLQIQLVFALHILHICRLWHVWCKHALLLFHSEAGFENDSVFCLKYFFLRSNHGHT